MSTEVKLMHAKWIVPQKAAKLLVIKLESDHVHYSEV